MILARNRVLPLSFAMLGAVVAVYLLLTAWLTSVAHAAADPVPTAQAATDASWALVQQYGPLWGGFLLLFGLVSSLLRANESTHWIAQGRRLALLSGLAMTAGAVADWHFHGAPFAGVIVTAVMAIKLVWSPTVAPAPLVSAAVTAGPPPPSPPSLMSTAAMLAVLVLGAGALQACGPKSVAVEHAVWDCTTPERAALVDAAKPLAVSAVEKVRNPDGSLDAEAFKALFAKANLLTEAGLVLSCVAIESFSALASNGSAVAARADNIAAAPSSSSRDQLQQLRAEMFGTEKFRTSAGVQ